MSQKKLWSKNNKKTRIILYKNILLDKSSLSPHYFANSNQILSVLLEEKNKWKIHYLHNYYFFYYTEFRILI